MNAHAIHNDDHVADADYAVIGLGATGRACLRYLCARGARVVAMDTRAAPPALDEVRAAHPAVALVTGGLDGALLARCATIVVSPGVPLELPALSAARAAGQAVIGDIELFARHARAPVVAVTGTNGKSTVTTLAADMLEGAGLRVRRGGNLGTPALDLLGADEPDCYVLELSSFQLDLTSSLAPAAAALLNISPDHLDRHGTLAAYAAAKARIFAHAAVAVVNADDPLVRALPTPGRRLEFSLGAPGAARYGVRSVGGEAVLAAPHGDLLPCRELAMVGRHNVANALAALALASALGADEARAVTVLRAFRGLPHRAEHVATVAGVRYVNDSKATNPGAAIATLEGLVEQRNAVLIAGGEPKGTGFAEFADCAVRHAHTLVLIGTAAGAIERAVAGRRPCLHARDMDAAVRAAQHAARTGDLVLLSPACASFDMFANYAARGAAFRAAVAALAGA